MYSTDGVVRVTDVATWYLAVYFFLAQTTLVLLVGRVDAEPGVVVGDEGVRLARVAVVLRQVHLR